MRPALDASTISSEMEKKGYDPPTNTGGSFIGRIFTIAFAVPEENAPVEVNAELLYSPALPTV